MSSRSVSHRALRTASALTLALGTGLAGSAVLSGTAHAAPPSATAALNDNSREVHYTAASGQANEVKVKESSAGGADLTFEFDDVVPIDAGKGCSHPDGADLTKVSCTVTTLDSQSPYRVLQLELGDGDDSIAFDNAAKETYYTNSLDLGPGDDEATDTGGVNANFVSGREGNDTVSVGEGGVAFGHEGDDTIDALGDGTIAEGGAGEDVLRGGEGGQHLHGNEDNDTVHGGKGDDLLYGEEGDDVLYGNSGDDQLYGGPGSDRLSGGPGTDVVEQD